MPPHAPTPQADDVWAKASSLHLLDLVTKVLGIEQQVFCQQIGVSRATMSYWATRQRPIPPKYRPRLLEWAQVAYEQAQERNHKEVASLPTDALKVAAIEAFYAPVHRWQIEVLYEAGEVKASARKNARWLLELLHLDTWTARDVDQMQSLWQVLGNKLAILREMVGPDDASATQGQDGES